MHRFPRSLHRLLVMQSEVIQGSRNAPSHRVGIYYRKETYTMVGETGEEKDQEESWGSEKRSLFGQSEKLSASSTKMR